MIAHASVPAPLWTVRCPQRNFVSHPDGGGVCVNELVGRIY